MGRSTNLAWSLLPLLLLSSFTASGQGDPPAPCPSGQQPLAADLAFWAQVDPVFGRVLNLRLGQPGTPAYLPAIQVLRDPANTQPLCTEPLVLGSAELDVCAATGQVHTDHLPVPGSTHTYALSGADPLLPGVTWTTTLHGLEVEAAPGDALEVTCEVDAAGGVTHVTARARVERIRSVGETTNATFGPPGVAPVTLGSTTNGAIDFHGTLCLEGPHQGRGVVPVQLCRAEPSVFNVVPGSIAYRDPLPGTPLVRDACLAWMHPENQAAAPCVLLSRNAYGSTCIPLVHAATADLSGQPIREGRTTMSGESKPLQIKHTIDHGPDGPGRWHSSVVAIAEDPIGPCGSADVLTADIEVEVGPDIAGAPTARGTGKAIFQDLHG